MFGLFNEEFNVFDIKVLWLFTSRGSHSSLKYPGFSLGILLLSHPDPDFCYIMEQDLPLRKCISQISFPRFKGKAILILNIINPSFFYYQYPRQTVDFLYSLPAVTSQSPETAFLKIIIVLILHLLHWLLVVMQMRASLSVGKWNVWDSNCHICHFMFTQVPFPYILWSRFTISHENWRQPPWGPLVCPQIIFFRVEFVLATSPNTFQV